MEYDGERIRLRGGDLEAGERSRRLGGVREAERSRRGGVRERRRGIGERDVELRRERDGERRRGGEREIERGRGGR